MADLVTNKGKFEIMNGVGDLDGADLRILLIKTTIPTAATNFITDVVELTVGGYARQTLAAKSVTEDDANGMAYMDATDPVFTALVAGETIIGACLFRHTGADATAPIYTFYDLTDTPTNGGDVTVQFATPANGAALKGA